MSNEAIYITLPSKAATSIRAIWMLRFEKLLYWLAAKVNGQEKQRAISLDKLMTYPSGSLGQDLGLVLKKRMKGGAEIDMHCCLLLLLYPEDERDEDAFWMRFALLGNGQVNKTNLLLCSQTWLLYPELRPQLMAAFNWGQQKNKFSLWDLRHLLREPTRIILAMINKESVGESEAPFI